MIYRRPSLSSRERFVFSVVGTGAILVGAACGDTMVPSSAGDTEDASDEFQGCIGICGTSTSGSAASSGFVGSSASGTSASSSSGCPNGSSGGCNLISYDATSDAIENLDTGSDQEAEARDGNSDGAPEAGDSAAETGDP